MMPKTLKPHSQETLSFPYFHSRHPWKCKHRSDHSEIVAFAETSRRWESIAIIQSTSGGPAQPLAEFISDLVNRTQGYGVVLDAACETLETIVRVGLNFSTEEDANEIIARIKNLRPMQKQSSEET